MATQQRGLVVEAGCAMMPLLGYRTTGMNGSTRFSSEKESLFLLVSCLVFSSVLKMEAICCSEKSGYQRLENLMICF
jgi:hypothetical protein